MTSISNFEKEILNQINKHRTSLNLNILTYNSTIQSFCHKHSNKIAQGIVPFGHDGFKARANELIKLLQGTAVSENVAMGQQSPEEVVSSWIKSEKHKKNLEGDYNLTGISIIKNTTNENIFTQIFVKGFVPSVISKKPALSSEDNLIYSDPETNKINYSILKQINQYRITKNLSELQIDTNIQNMAIHHAQKMANSSISLSHKGFKKRAESLIEKIGGSTVAENVALGQKDASLIVESWLNSIEHRINIEGDYNLTGIGIAISKNNEYYYCQIFLKH
ncbi:MAG: CAP domain-containing protein [Saprospiraceae bacterium]|nr:CAP domain-containing protein [Saprospiraceae bacterium]